MAKQPVLSRFMILNKTFCGAFVSKCSDADCLDMDFFRLLRRLVVRSSSIRSEAVSDNTDASSSSGLSSSSEDDDEVHDEEKE